jgi:hypothetical protein
MPYMCICTTEKAMEQGRQRGDFGCSRYPLGWDELSLPDELLVRSDCATRGFSLAKPIVMPGEMDMEKEDGGI